MQFSIWPPSCFWRPSLILPPYYFTCFMGWYLWNDNTFGISRIFENMLDDIASYCFCIQNWYWAIPWWRLWPKFENFSLLIDHSSYNKQAINHFVVDVRSTLGGQSTATPQKINLGQGQAQCPCNARWRLWLRTKVGSASESLQSPISVKCDRVLCQHLYIWWTTYC